MNEDNKPTFDTEYTEKIVCPNCGAEYVDDEHGYSDAEDDEYYCDDCETYFTVSAHHEITYITHKRSQSPYELREWCWKEADPGVVPDIDVAALTTSIYYARYFFPGNVPMQIKYLKWPCGWKFTGSDLVELTDIITRWEETDDERWVKPRMRQIAMLRDHERDVREKEQEAGDGES